MNFLDLYFDETNQEFNNVHTRNNNIVVFVEDESFVKLEFNDDGTQFKVLEFSEDDFMAYLEDEYLLNKLYTIIKNNYIKENWLFILSQIIFDLTYMKDYSSLKKFIKDHIYQEYTTKSLERNNLKKIEN